MSMSPDLPRGWRGRLLAMGITIALLALLWNGVATPLIGAYDTRAELLLQKLRLSEHMENLAINISRLREQSSSLSDNASARAVIRGDSDAIAAAAMQQRLQEFSEHLKITLQSVEVLPAQTVSPMRRIAIRVSLTATWPALVEFLKLILGGSGGPRMLVDDLHIVAPRLTEHSAIMSLNASFTVLAFRKIADNQELQKSNLVARAEAGSPIGRTDSYRMPR